MGFAVLIATCLLLATPGESRYHPGSIRQNDDVHEQKHVFATSELDINITAEQHLLLYADGVYVGQHSDNTRSAYFSLPENTLVYAAEVTPGPAPVYSALRASTSFGEVTDTSWRCTATYFQGWEQTNFDDRAWPTCVVNSQLSPDMPYDIAPAAQWIHGNSGDQTVYFRKTRRVVYNCDTGMCQNGGTCLTLIDNKMETVACNCLPVYMGEYCEIPATKIITSYTCGATCQSSSYYDASSTCTAAIDGSYLAGNDWVTDPADIGGQWLSVNFGEFYTVTSMAIIQRCYIGAQSSKIAVLFSSGSAVEYDLPCVEIPKGDSCQEIVLDLNLNSTTITNFVRVELVELCTAPVIPPPPTQPPLYTTAVTEPDLTTSSIWFRALRWGTETTAWNTEGARPTTVPTTTQAPVTISPGETSAGLNEVLAYALDAALENVASLNCGATCAASSVYHDVDFACENALDEETGPELGNSWIADHQGPGSWIIVNLPVTQTIVGVGLLQLCSENGQARDVRLEFSDGTSVDVQLECFGERLCTGQYWQHFNLTPTRTQYVRVTIMSTCTNDNSGFREIRIFSYSGAIPAEGQCPK